MIRREMSDREFDKRIKKILLDKFGYSEFRIYWDELSELLELSLTKTKYHIDKLANDSYKFLTFIERSKRSEGYTSPNVIIINKEETFDDATELDKRDQRIRDLEAEVKNVPIYKDEIRRLDNELKIIKEKYNSVYKENHELRTQLLERR